MNHCYRGKEIRINYRPACACACVWVPGHVGVFMSVRACSPAFQASKTYAPYCDVICGPSVSTKFFDIFS